MTTANIPTYVVDRLREELAKLHQELVRYGLVVWTDGNVSVRIPETDLMLIKPSGVSYDRLEADSMVLCDQNGRAVEGDALKPSVDTTAHAYVYRSMPDVGGVVHTHSPYASAWAAAGQPIPCVLTGIADEFGGEVPIGPFAGVDGEEIGRGVVSSLTRHRSPAVLMRNHGVFAVGRSPRAAVKAAVLCENAARSVLLARQVGQPQDVPPEEVTALFNRYQHTYGQRSANRER